MRPSRILGGQIGGGESSALGPSSPRDAHPQQLQDLPLILRAHRRQPRGCLAWATRANRERPVRLCADRESPTEARLVFQGRHPRRRPPGPGRRAPRPRRTTPGRPGCRRRGGGSRRASRSPGRNFEFGRMSGQVTPPGLPVKSHGPWQSERVAASWRTVARCPYPRRCLPEEGPRRTEDRPGDRGAVLLPRGLRTPGRSRRGGHGQAPGPCPPGWCPRGVPGRGHV